MFGYEFTRTLSLTCEEKTCYRTPLKIYAKNSKCSVTISRTKRKKMQCKNSSVTNCKGHERSPPWGQLARLQGVPKGVWPGPRSCFQLRSSRKPDHLPGASCGSQPWVPAHAHRASPEHDCKTAQVEHLDLQQKQVLPTDFLANLMIIILKLKRDFQQSYQQTMK